MKLITLFLKIVDWGFSLPIIRSYPKLFRYLISGGTAAVVDLVFLYIFTSILGIWYLLSSVLAFLIAFVVSFTMQKFWTFADHSTDRWKSQAMLYFVIVSTNNLGLNTLLMYIFVDFFHFHYLVAQFVISGLIAVESYFIYQIFVFKKRPLKAPPSHEQQ